MKQISATKIAKYLLIAILILTIIHAFQLFILSFKYGIRIKMFDLDVEENIPTLFQTLHLWYSAYLIWMITKFKKVDGESYVFLWGLLCFVFVFLGLDEALRFHERTSIYFKEIVESGAFRFQWVIPYFFLVALFVISYIKFFLHLSRKFKILFFLSGFTYVFGAMGMEMIGSMRMDVYGRLDIFYNTLKIIEEDLEMLGIVFFSYTLSMYLLTGIEKKRKIIIFSKYELIK